MHIQPVLCRTNPMFITRQMAVPACCLSSEAIRFGNSQGSKFKKLFLPIAAAVTMATAIFTTSPKTLFATYSPQQTALIKIESLEKSKNIDAIIAMLNKPAKRSNPLYVRDFYTEKLKKNDAYTAAENALARLITSQNTDIKTIEKLDESLQPKAKNRLKHYKPSYTVFDAINKRLGRNIEVKIYYKD